MKKILAIAAVAALTAGVSAYAANPFSDVSTSDWAYQAVSELSDQGIVEGYPDGTFKGERNITRYELAQIIARLMANEDQYNAEQRAMIDQLASEYADELNNLGVRVGNLESKVGNISWSGDARMHFQHVNWGDQYTGRIRLNAKAQVNDHIFVEGRLGHEMDFKDSSKDSGLVPNSTGVSMDRLHAVWMPTDKFSVDLGRTGVELDQSGVFWDEDAIFDGVVVSAGSEKAGVSAGYGRFKSVEFLDAQYKDQASREAWFGRGYATVGALDVSAFYVGYLQNHNTDAAKNFLAQPEVKADKKADVWGFGASVDLGHNLKLDGDYVQTLYKMSYNGKKLLNNPTMWTLGLTYGEVDTDMPGSYSFGIRYVDADYASNMLGATGLDLEDQFHYSYEEGTGVSFWAARAAVAVQKNVELAAYYNFGAKSDVKGKANPKNSWGMELNYTF